MIKRAERFKRDSSQPYTFELARVSARASVAFSLAAGCYQDIITADWLTCCLEFRSDAAVLGVGRYIERNNIALPEDIFDDPEQLS